MHTAATTSTAYLDTMVRRGEEEYEIHEWE
jgi:hypothetical protein